MSCFYDKTTLAARAKADSGRDDDDERTFGPGFDRSKNMTRSSTVAGVEAIAVDAASSPATVAAAAAAGVSTLDSSGSEDGGSADDNLKSEVVKSRRSHLIIRLGRRFSVSVPYIAFVIILLVILDFLFEKYSGYIKDLLKSDRSEVSRDDAAPLEKEGE